MRVLNEALIQRAVEGDGNTKLETINNAPPQEKPINETSDDISKREHKIDDGASGRPKKQQSKK